VLNVTVNFGEVKVKVKGQNGRTENLPLAITWLWFKMSPPNLAQFDRRRPTVGTKYAF